MSISSDDDLDYWSESENEGPANISAAQHWVSAATARFSHFQSLQMPSYDRRQARAARRYLKTEVKAVQHAMALVKRHQNVFLPIYRLPDELLSLILIMWSEIQPHYYPEPEALEDLVQPYPQRLREPRAGWLHGALSTCHRFREVALATPALWSNVTFSLGLECAELFLKCSKALPILMDVWMPWDDDKDEENENIVESIYAHVRGNMHRTHTLRIINHNEDPYNEGNLPSLLQQAPLLHTFWLYNSSSWATTFPDPIFASHAPGLKEVILRGLRTLNWAPAAFVNLRSLVVDDQDKTLIRPEEDLMLFFEDLQQHLQNMPLLESLTLRKALPNAIRFEGPLDSFPAVTLPRLTYLEISGEFRVVIVMLLALQWHKDARIHIICQGNFQRQSSADRFFGYLKNRLQLESCITEARTMHMSLSGSYGPYDIRLWREEHNLPISLARLPVADFQMVVDLRSTTRHIEDLFAILPLIPLRSIAIHDLKQASWSRENWRPPFLRFKNVVRVSCEGIGMGESLIEALYDDIGLRKRSYLERLIDSDDSDEEEKLASLPTPENFLFPNLGLLYLPSVNWTSLDELRKISHARIDSDTHLPAFRFQDVVEERDKKGRPLMAVFSSSVTQPPRCRGSAPFGRHLPHILDCFLLDGDSPMADEVYSYDDDW
ncbi:hypothetical protein PENSPDRAFT_733742 [Peniophora sp. CONT]|nr:hypothetical protein PENSPDRAFT_733742 [Peniophora sp. CONT]